MSQFPISPYSFKELSDLEAHRFRLVLEQFPRFRRTPLTYTFNVKYYGGQPVNVRAMLKCVSDDVEKHQSYSLYFHYPYCRYICHFCHYPVKKISDNSIRDNMELVDQLISHFDLLLARFPTLRNYPLSSIYLGGGTPSLLIGEELVRFSELIRSRVKQKENAEWTIEATPDSLADENLQHIVAAGFNRLSTGIQVLDDATLKRLNRNHSAEQARSSLHLLHLYPQLSLNVDLMYGLPGVSTKKFFKDVVEVVKSKPHTLTLYRLRLGRSDERAAPMYKLYQWHSQEYPSQLETLLQVTGARRFLLENGYNEAPLGWFNLQGHESQCYEDRWLKQIPMFGIGMAAYSYGANWQYLNHRDYEQWQGEIEQKRIPYARGILLDSGEANLRAAAFKLRYTGEMLVSQNDYRGPLGEIARQILKTGLAEQTLSGIALNEIGKAFIDEIIDEHFQKGGSAIGETE